MVLSEMGKRLLFILLFFVVWICLVVVLFIFFLFIFRILWNCNEEVRYNNGDVDLKRRKGWVYVGRWVCKVGRMMMMMMM